MANDPELPSARRILETDASATRQTAERANDSDTGEEDFRRVLTALRAVLQIRGS